MVHHYYVHFASASLKVILGNLHRTNALDKGSKALRTACHRVLSIFLTMLHNLTLLSPVQLKLTPRGYAAFVLWC